MTEKTGGVPKPNYTGIPNALFELMPLMKEAELRVVLAICRQTFGWHRKSDRISLSQLKEMTGLSRPAIVRAIAQGEERGLIKRREVKKGDPQKGHYYSLVVNESNHSEEEERLTKATTSGKRKQPPATRRVVTLSNTQKKEKESIKENGGVDVPHNEPPPAPRPTAAAFTESVTTDGAESVILAALERLNQGIRGNGGGKVITGTQAIARRLAARGETVESMRTAWAACKSNADNPIGAFVFWTKEQYTPPPKAGFETRTDEHGNRMVWVDGQGWMTVTRSTA
jgi:phage replication O-like protein O